jgi:hypothetical protein
MKGADMPTEEMNISWGHVYVATIELAETVLAVGRNEATAKHWAGVHAAQFLNDRGGVNPNTGEQWNAYTVAEYFGVRVTLCEIDGDGVLH